MSVVQSAGALLSVGGSSGSPFWHMVPQLMGRDSSADLVGDYASIYRTQPNVQTVVRFRARNVAQLGLHAFRRSSDTERDRLPPGHELAQVIARPNRRMGRYRFFESVEADLCTFGNHFSVKTRSDALGGRLELVRIPAQYVRIAEGGSWLYAQSYEIVYGDKVIEVDADEMFHVATHNPDDPRYGLSPLESLRRVLNEEESAGRYRENFWLNAARIEGVLSHPGKLTAGRGEVIRSDWERLNTGDAASGRTAVLEEGMTFTPVSFNAKDAQYLEARKLTREECASALHVMPAHVGILEHANFANMVEQRKSLYQDTLGPECELIQDEFERQVLPDIADTTDVYVEFNIAEKLKGSFEERAAVIQTSVGAPYITRNEARALDNRPPLPGGDELVTPLNVLIGGQASPTDSAPKTLRDVITNGAVDSDSVEFVRKTQP